MGLTLLKQELSATFGHRHKWMARLRLLLSHSRDRVVKYIYEIAFDLSGLGDRVGGKPRLRLLLCHSRDRVGGKPRLLRFAQRTRRGGN